MAEPLQYVTREGDTVDYICHRVYGTTAGTVVEVVLLSNPGLADAGPVLPAGLVVTLPEQERTVQVRGVKLWD